MVYSYVAPYTRHLAIIVLAVVLYMYLQSNNPSNNECPNNENARLFTQEEVARCNGVGNSVGLYLVIMGEVYDVEKGRKHYGPGETYNMFIGHDATKSFITGDFDEYSEELSDISSLTGTELLSLVKWKTFYNETYVYKGKLIGRYYDKEGSETEYCKLIMQKVVEAKLNANVPKQEFPSCNVEWKAETGSRVWCTNRSGDGIQRDWVGVPRKYVVQQETTPFCVCVPENVMSEKYAAFPGCGLFENDCLVADDVIDDAGVVIK